MISLFSFSFTYGELAIFVCVALLIGMSKTGVHGAGMMAVPLLAAIFGGQLSSGILLPMLCLADVLGVWYYHRHASWSHLKKLFPWAILGTIAGTVVGRLVDDSAFKVIMAVVIILSVIIMLWLEKGHKVEIPGKKWFAALTGTAGGFTSMVGNLAGSVMAVYFLSMRLPKNQFIGTTAWFFMVINWFKVPFHVFAWKTISWNTFLLNLMTLPAIVLGGLVGILLVKNIPETSYRWFIISMTLIAAAFMFI
ncbi:MAG TPA: sulfite exporter TauE/SafE family protein [Chryseosolibacter sp.]